MSLNYFSYGIEAKGGGMGGIDVCMYEKKNGEAFSGEVDGRFGGEGIDEITKSFILNILIITLGLF